MQDGRMLGGYLMEIEKRRKPLTDHLLIKGVLGHANWSRPQFIAVGGKRVGTAFGGIYKSTTKATLGTSEF